MFTNAQCFLVIIFENLGQVLKQKNLVFYSKFSKKKFQTVFLKLLYNFRQWVNFCKVGFVNFIYIQHPFPNTYLHTPPTSVSTKISMSWYNSSSSLSKYLVKIDIKAITLIFLINVRIFFH